MKTKRPSLWSSTRFNLRVALAGLAIVCCANSTPGQERAANRLELQTEKVIVFKDGYALVIKRGVATTDENGDLYTTQVPDAAILGSFWASSSNGRLGVMNAGWEELATTRTVAVPCRQTFEIIEANVGSDCEVELDDQSVHSGQILRTLSRPVEEILDAHTLGTLGVDVQTSDDNSSTVTHVVQSQHGTHFVLRNQSGDLLLSVDDVKKLSIPDMQTTIDRELKVTRLEKRLTFNFDEPNAERELVVVYFRPGVRWIPTYRIALDENDGDQQIARLELQAELLNEAEDLADVDIDIVVGVPNFRFRDIASPLTLEQTLRNSLVQAAPQIANQFGNNNFVSNSIMTQRPSDFSPSGFEGSGADVALNLPADLSTSQSQELFIYELDSMSIDRGERAALPILSADVEYRDVYTWDAHLVRDDVAYGPNEDAGSPLRLSKNEVWRQIDMINRSTVPWTTGAVMITEGQQPLAQELLTYTPAGDACRIPLTVSVDLRGRYVESEVGREINALTWNRNNYTKVRQRADFSLVNHKDHAVDVEITARFGGKVDSVSDDGKITVTPFQAADWSRYRGEPAVNNSSIIQWRVSLEPGEEFAPNVEYHFFARQ